MVDDDAIDQSDWYADADGDGFGDADETTAACEAPTGFIADATDCDDNDSAVSPSADEVCNGSDDNCDGTIDEEGVIDGLMCRWIHAATSFIHGISCVRVCEKRSSVSKTVCLRIRRAASRR